MFMNEGYSKNSDLPADGVIGLLYSGNCQKHNIHYINYAVILLDNGNQIGTCNFRYGDAEFESYAGNVGYEIDERYRGNRYAKRTVCLLKSELLKHGIEEMIICCSPDNEASKRTCISAGAEYRETVKVPPDSELYAYGKRETMKYVLKLK